VFFALCVHLDPHFTSKQWFLLLGVELCDQSHDLTLRSCFAILSRFFCLGGRGVRELKEEFGIFSKEGKKNQSQAKTR
jgi:hypothetical protein